MKINKQPLPIMLIKNNCRSPKNINYNLRSNLPVPSPLERGWGEAATLQYLQVLPAIPF